MRQEGDQRKPTEVKTENLIKIFRAWKPTVAISADDDRYMIDIYRKFGIVPHLAPHCWDYLYHDPGQLPEEVAWRK